MADTELKSVRATGRSVDEAIFKGLQQLEISIDEVSIEIIQTETKGILGIGAKPAIVELTQRPAEDFDVPDYMRKSETDRPERREKRDRREKNDRRDRHDRREKPKADKPESKKADISGETDPHKEKPEPKAEEKAERPAKNTEAPREERREKRDRREKQERREKPEQRREEVRPVKAETEKPEPKAEEKPAEKTEKPEAKPEKVIEYTLEAAEGNPAAEFVQGLIERMGATGRVLAAQDEDCLRLRIDSEMMGMLIGHRGETLDAMQYLTGLVVNRNRKTEGYTRVTLNTEEYREKREETLRRLAKKVAAQVRATGRPRVLEPMNPYERRVLHSTLQNNPDVTTHSEGEEPNRRVVVTPRRKARGGYTKNRSDRRRPEHRSERRVYEEDSENDVISREEYMRLYEAAKAARIPSLDRRPPEPAPENNNEK